MVALETRFFRIPAQRCFFFLRVNELEIARVEVPAWLAEDPLAVDSIRATVLADSRMTVYSYTLAGISACDHPL
jgi:hypothetical protein